MSDFGDVGDFHRKFDLLTTSKERRPTLISKELQEFRVKFLEEELAELKEGYELEDLPKIADALVDLVYVALGTAHLHGLPWASLFAEVQRANMQKVRATRAEDSTRGSTFDVVKPPGWKAPAIMECLLIHNWPGRLLPLEDEK